MSDFSVTARFGLRLPTLLSNAAGVCDTTEEELLRVDRSSAGAMVSKSCTFEPRVGNPTPKYYATDRLSINSTGLTNRGYTYYFDLDDRFETPYFVSVATGELDELAVILDRANRSLVAGLEINLSCPNLAHSPLSSDLSTVERVLNFVSERCEKPWGVKLPAYFDPSLIKRTAEVIGRSRASFVVCLNSLANGLVINADDETAIHPKSGLGGIGGSVVKSIGLSNVYQFKRWLPDLDLVGCGGISSGRDVYEYLLCGASWVQIGTQLMEEGSGCFDRILEELQIELRGRTLEEVRGSLRVRSKD